MQTRPRRTTGRGTLARTLIATIMLLTFASTAQAATEVEGDGYTARIPAGYAKLIDSCSSGGG